MGKTSIEWTDRSINPIRARNLATGSVGHFCERVSPGCAACYAATWNSRVRPSGKHLIGLGLDYVPANRPAVETFLDVDKLLEVIRRRTPTKWFWCDMTDMFGEWVPDAVLDVCVVAMMLTKQHTHQLLTKRAERMRAYWTGLVEGAAAMTPEFRDRWDAARKPIYEALRQAGDPRFEYVGMMMAHPTFPLPNVWLGVSVENQHFADERIPLLLQTPAAVRFISAEPLLESVTIRQYLMAGDDPGKCANCGRGHGFTRCPNYGGIAPARDESRCKDFKRVNFALDWVIVGGESGGGARYFNIEWARAIVAQCKAASVPCFIKQLGANPYQQLQVNGGTFTDPMCRKGHGKLLDRKGGDPDEWPEDLRVREFPEART